MILLVLGGTLGGVFGGPALGDHEALVAQCARDMRLSGDWLVPRFLDTPFVRKPPLPYWLVAASSYLFPNDRCTGLPVTTGVARLPSALAAFGTVLLLWRLGSAMFSRRAGLVTAVVAGSSLFFLLYGANVTAEMILTFCCTWAYVHFWFAVTGRHPARRRLHLLFFYIALGFAMLAKGPVPITMTALPLMVWWYTERPLRLLARRGRAAARNAGISFLRDLRRRTIAAFTRLWLLPGLVVFALCFVPWMWAVAARYPYAWNLWNWQYFQRAQGNYEDTRVRSVLYYLPIIAGYVVPWLFLSVEAVAAPWLKRYVRMRRGLLYAGLWAAVGIVLMSLMAFKKPYYVGPAIPGLVLLIAVVAERVFACPPAAARRAWTVWGVGAVAAIIALVAGAVGLQHSVPAVSTRLTIIAAGALALLLVAGVVYVRGRGWVSLGITAVTAVATFHAVWYACGPALDNVDKVSALAQALEACAIPTTAQVVWADQRPDARLSFYFNRRSEHMITPQEIVDRMVDRTRGKDTLRRMAVERAAELLSGDPADHPVYLILDRKHYDQWRSDVSLHGHQVASVPGDPRFPAEDWVIVSNVVPPTI